MADISIPEGDNPVRYQASLGGNQKYRNMGNVSGQAYLVRGQVTNVYYQKGTLDFNTYGSSSTSGVTDGSGSAPIPVDFWGKNTDGKVFGCYRPVQKGSQILVAYIGGDTSRPIVIGVYPDNEASYELISPVHYNTGDDSTDDVQNDALGERKIYPNQQMMYESGKGDILRSMGGKSFLYISENGSGYLDDINYAYDEISDFYDADANEIEPTMTKAQSWLLVHEDNDSDEESDGHRTRFYVNRSGELMVTFANKDDPNNIVVLEASKDSGFKLTKRFDNSNIKEDSEDYVQFGIGNGNNVSIKSVDSDDATSFYLDNGNIELSTPKEGSITFDGTSVNDLLGKVSDAENAANDASDKADSAASAGAIAQSAASDAASQALAASYAGEDAKSAAVNAQAAGEDAKAQVKDTRDRIIYYASISNEKDVAVPGKYIIVNTDTYIANGTIKTAHIGDAAITNAKIANLAVGTAQLEDAAITRAKIGNLAVGTAQIEDAAITDAKVGNLSADHLNAGTIDFSVINGTHINASEIDVGKIVADQIFVNGLGDISKNLGTVTSGKITGTNINSDVDNLNDPNSMSVIEKQTAVSQYAGLTSQYNVILARAKDDGISTTDLTTAYTNLNNFITPILKDTTTASTIDRYTYNSLTFAYNMALSNVQTALKDSFNADIDNMHSNVSVASQAASSAVIVASQAAITGDNASQVASRASMAANEAKSAGDNATSVANTASQAASGAVIAGSTASVNADKAIVAANQAKTAGDDANSVASKASQAASSAVLAGSTATVNADKAIKVANQAKTAGNDATSVANTASQAASGAVIAGSTASVNADKAIVAANDAQSAGNNATSVANTASQAASSAVIVASQAMVTGNNASQAASGAVLAGSTASVNADKAITDASQAQIAGNNAISVANNASQAASSAVLAGSTATVNAGKAAEVANQAKSAGDNATSVANTATSVANSARSAADSTYAYANSEIAVQSTATAKAQSRADNAFSKAQEVGSQANSEIAVQSTATAKAQSTADNAFSKAQEVGSQADSEIAVQSTATAKAQSTADNAFSQAQEVGSQASAEIAVQSTATAKAQSRADNAFSKAATAIDSGKVTSQAVTDLKDGSKLTIAELENGLAKKVANSEYASYKTETANLIGSKVATKDFSTYKTQTANLIAKKVATKDFTAYQATTAKAIESKVESSDFNTYKTQTADTISSKVESSDFQALQTQVNNSAVGANLLLGTKDFDNLSSWADYNSNWDIITDTYNGLSIAQANQDWNGLSQYTQVSAGETYTFSIYARYVSGTGTSTLYTVLNNDPENGHTAANVSPSYKNVSLTSDWQRVSITFTITSDGWIKPRIERTSTNKNTLQICGMKLEKGSVATDWSLNPEDQATKSQITQLSGEIEQKVDNGTFSSYKTETAKLIGSKVSNGDFSTYQKQTADLIAKKVATKDFTAYQATTAKAISSKVESDDFNTYKSQTDKAILSKVSSAKYTSDKTQTDKDISSKVSSDDFSSYKTETAKLIGSKVATKDFSTYQKQTNDLIAAKVATKDFTAYQATTAKAISSKVESKDFNSYKTQTADTISEKVATADFTAYQDTTAKAISSKVESKDFSSYKTETAKLIGSKVSNGDFSTYQKQTAELISAKVATKDFSSYKEETARSIGSMVKSQDFNTYKTQTDKAILSKVSSTDFKNLTISNRNLALGTATAFKMTGNGTENNTRYMYSLSKTIAKGTTVTISFDITSTNATGNYTIQLLQLVNENPDVVGPFIISKSSVSRAYISPSGGSWQGSTMLPLTAGTQHCSYTLVTNADYSDGIKLRLDNSTATVAVSNFIISESSKEVAWTPAPEDQATKSQITQLSGEIDLRVTKGDLVDQINIQAGKTLISSSGQLILSGKSVVLDSVDPVIMNSANIGKLAVGTAQIANGAITDAKIGKLAVGTAQIKYEAVGAAQIAKLAVGTAQIDDGAITNAKIGKLAVGTAQIADGAITNAQIGNEAVGNAQIKDEAVNSAKIDKLAVGTAQIGDGAITNAKIGKLAVGTAQIGSEAVGTAQIGDGAITNAKIGKLAVGTAQIANGAITEAQIGSLAVGNAQIKDAAINSAKIAKLAVGTAQIGDGAITNAKIGKLAVGTAQIANGTITDAKVGNVSANKLTAGTIDFNTITGKNINASNITTGKLNTDRLNVNKLSAVSGDLGDITTGTLKGVNIVAKTFSTPNGSFTTDKNGSVVASNLTIRGVTNLVYNAALLGGSDSTIPGWSLSNNGYCALNIIHDGVPSIGWNNTTGGANWVNFAQSKLYPLNGNTGQPFSASVWFKELGSDTSLQYQFTLAFFDSNGNRIDGGYVSQTWNGIGSGQDWRYITINNAAAPSNAVSVGLQYWSYNGKGNACFSSPMLTQTAQSTGYQPDTGNIVNAGIIKGSTISASTINGGTINGITINGSTINGVTINTGVINGSNLKIDLNTGKILFQKGVIKSTNDNLNIDIDSGKMGVTNSEGNGFRFEDGKLFLTSDDWIDSIQSKPDYGYITYMPDLFSNVKGMKINGTDGIALTTGNYDSYHLWLDHQPDSGAALSLRDNTALLNARELTHIEGGSMYSLSDAGKINRACFIIGGTNGSDLGYTSAVSKGGIYDMQAPKDVGPDIFMQGRKITLQGGGNSGGDPNQMADLNFGSDSKSGLIQSGVIYNRTYSSGSNVYITSYGTLGRATSASKYKLDITKETSLAPANNLLSIDRSSWIDKSSAEMLADSKTNGTELPEPEMNAFRHYGLIAEDLIKAGLDEFVIKGKDGQAEGIEYGRLWTVLIPKIRQLSNDQIQNKMTISKLESEIEELKQER